MLYSGRFRKNVGGYVALTINPRTYTQTYNPTVVKEGGRGLLQPLAWVFAVLQYCGNILTLIDSLSCDLQDKVKIMGYDAVGGL